MLNNKVTNISSLTEHVDHMENHTLQLRPCLILLYIYDVYVALHIFYRYHKYYLLIYRIFCCGYFGIVVSVYRITISPGKTLTPTNKILICRHILKLMWKNVTQCIIANDTLSYLYLDSLIPPYYGGLTMLLWNTRTATRNHNLGITCFQFYYQQITPGSHLILVTAKHMYDVIFH